MATMLEILNTIRASASAEYQARIPLATRTNLATIGNVVLTYTPIANEFLDIMVNKIAMTLVSSKTINNPLSVLKSGTIPLGNDIEDLFVNPATGETFDGQSTDLLAVTTPDVKVLYYRKNRTDKYKASVNRPQLINAFTSFDNLDKLLQGIVNSLYSGDNFDEFILTKQMIHTAYTAGHVKTQRCLMVNSEQTAKAFIKAVRGAANLMVFPTSKYNMYAQVTADAKPVVTWTPTEDQIFLIDAHILAECDVEVLAMAYNMDKTTFLNVVVPVDDFGGAPILGMICDKSWFKIYDYLVNMESFYNPSNMTTKYYYHHWQAFCYSLFANALIFDYDIAEV